ncbi:hypothetical protein NLJ89_g11206 [Agrocybe chaxingu]|uniref:N-acetyltransferase domain-containing protein n=1 Tax=Agrocybe chaxingu TaxID=84603 RepID=A0A9W8JPP5_9AGAR|nr:hypothetical protein NLJ89_g11206 [Agrocybe chaxingu]
MKRDGVDEQAWQCLSRTIDADLSFVFLLYASLYPHNLALSIFPARIHPQIVLETEYDNFAALSLYESLGFIREKRLYRFYLNGKDAFRLVLAVAPSDEDEDSVVGDDDEEMRGRMSMKRHDRLARRAIRVSDYTDEEDEVSER